jgi:glycosyl transferase family 25
MKIFIVNLKDSSDRRLKLESELNKLGLQHEFIEAVDGRKFTEAEIEPVTQKINYAFLPGEIGCALSHQQIYRKMIKDNIKCALILEDDVRLNYDIVDILDNIDLSNNKPEVVLLSRVNKFHKNPIKNITKNYSLHKTQHATTTHSYIINLHAANSLLDNLYPIWMVADKWSLFEDMSLLDIYSIIPHPVSLSSEAQNSTINTNKGDPGIEMKKKELWNKLMASRSLKTKLKHRYRRAVVPLLNKIIDQGKG